MSELDRIRWHCRRGMLELDLVLARFLERHLANFDARHSATASRPCSNIPIMIYGI